MRVRDIDMRIVFEAAKEHIQRLIAQLQIIIGRNNVDTTE